MPALVCFCLACAESSLAAALEDAFEGPEPTWQLEENRTVQKIQQQRIRIDRDDGPSGVEWVRYGCRPGFAAALELPIRHAPVIEEFAVSLAVRCEAPGAVLAVRVVLPRSTDPATGRPLTALLRGDRYESAGQWRTLSLDGAPRLTAGAARLLRTAPGAPPIDERGAFIDRVVLLLPGAATPVSAWLDDLKVEGVLAGDAGNAGGQGPLLPESRSPPPVADQRVTLDASGFGIGGRPFFPRVWSHAGGSLEAVRQAGFNTVAFDQAPSPETLAEAGRQGLRVMCPPPKTPRIDPRVWAPVLAWRVGGETLDGARAFADRIRRQDLALQRPLVAAVTGDWAAWSRVVDGLVLLRTHPNTPAGDHLWQDRVRGVARVSRPGAPLVQQVVVRHAKHVGEQLATFAGAGPEQRLIADHQLSADTFAAIAQGSAGVWLIEGPRLSGADAATVTLRRRLTLLNLRLDLIDPWLAGGTRGPLLSDSSGVDRAAVFKRGRVRLLTPLPSSVPPQQTGELVAPAAGDSPQAYRLTPAGLTPIRSRRGAGGVVLDANALRDWGATLLTEDRAAVKAIAQRVARTAKQAVDLQVSLARNELISRGPTTNKQQRPRSDNRRVVEQELSLANAARAAGKLPQAFDSATAARNALAAGGPPRGVDPLVRTPLALAASGGGLIERLELLLASATRGANLLAGGDFENLDETRNAGWINTTLPLAGVRADVELSTQSPGHGDRALRLSVSLDADATSPLVAGDCPVWVTSPATRLEAGQVVEVLGWVRLEPAPGEDRTRLIISDTLGGDRLGRVIDSAPSWRPFRLLRRAPREANLRVTFALTGAGAAMVDAVMIRPVLVGAKPTPPATLRPAAPVAVRPDADQAK